MSKMKKIMEYLKYQLDANEDEGMTEELIKMKLDEDTKQRWSKKLEEKYNYKKENIHRQKFLYRRWALAAASMLILTFAYLLINNNSVSIKQDNLAISYIDDLNILQDPNLIRKNVGQGDSLRQEAMLTYSSNKYSKTIEIYQQLSEQKKIEASDLLYWGIAHLKIGDYAKAIPLFKQLENGRIADQEADWCLALAYLASEDRESAQMYLEKIIDRRQYQHEKAKKLLKTLNKVE